ncbi:ATP-grasp domain-containing protein [Streptomyces sp. SM1P]
MSAAPHPRELLLIGGGGEMTLSVDVAVQALEQARARGLRTHVTNRADTLAATPAVTAAADTATAVDFARPGDTADWAAGRAADGERPALVFGVREMAQEAVAATAHALELPGNPPAAVRRIRTKDACRAALAAAGFRQPAVRVCRDASEARAFLAATAGPWVVKPRDGADSAGVRKVTGPDDLPAALAQLPDREVPFLVEEFVDGGEFSVEGVFVGGSPRVLAVTAKEKLPPPYFVEIGHVLPADLPEETRRSVEETVTAALTALELRFGLFHVELWLTAEGIVLGEVHVRIGGGWIHRMLPHVRPGLELYGTVYDDALGLPVDLPARLPAPERAAAARYFAPPEGRVTAVSGWDAVRTHPAVLHAELRVGPGDVVPGFRSGSDRVGAVVVGAATPAEARELARELVASVRFTVEPMEPVDAVDTSDDVPEVRVDLEPRPLTSSFRISHMTIETVDHLRLRLLQGGRTVGEGRSPPTAATARTARPSPPRRRHSPERWPRPATTPTMARTGPTRSRRCAPPWRRRRPTGSAHPPGCSWRWPSWTAPPAGPASPCGGCSGCRSRDASGSCTPCRSGRTSPSTADRSRSSWAAPTTNRSCARCSASPHR